MCAGCDCGVNSFQFEGDDGNKEAAMPQSSVPKPVLGSHPLTAGAGGHPIHGKSPPDTTSTVAARAGAPYSHGSAHPKGGDPPANSEEPWQAEQRRAVQGED